MHPLDILGDPVRRRLLELLADGEQSAGTLVDRIGQEFGISQPAVSQHLKVLRLHGFTFVRTEGQRRLYAIDAEPLREAEQWLSTLRSFWEPRLSALETEIARGKRELRVRSKEEPS